MRDSARLVCIAGFVWGLAFGLFISPAAAHHGGTHFRLTIEGPAEAFGIPLIARAYVGSEEVAFDPVTILADEWDLYVGFLEVEDVFVAQLFPDADLTYTYDPVTMITKLDPATDVTFTHPFSQELDCEPTLTPETTTPPCVLTSIRVTANGSTWVRTDANG